MANWLKLLLIMVAVVGVALLVRRFESCCSHVPSKDIRQEPSMPPGYILESKNSTEDERDGMMWRWRNDKSQSGIWYVRKISAIASARDHHMSELCEKDGKSDCDCRQDEICSCVKSGCLCQCCHCDDCRLGKE